MSTPTNNIHKISSYPYGSAALNHSHRYLLPALIDLLESTNFGQERRQIFELGCGNGSIANQLEQRGFDVTGVDPSKEGIEQANLAYPGLKLYEGSAYDNLAGRFGRFPVVISLEVVEHVYFPRQYADTLYSLVAEGGVAIVSTPYHGYWKNLAMALFDRMDAHFTALWDQGHIKFWSFKTLCTLLKEAGFSAISFQRVGRIPPLAKSMIAVAKKSS